jgi:general secretion pathway protein D
MVSILLAPLLACAGADKSIPEPDAVAPVRSTDFTARNPVAAYPQASQMGSPSHFLIVPGADGVPATAAPREAGAETRVASSDPAAVATGGIEINLDSADIQTAAKTLLGDILQLNFVVDPRVQGTVTLASVGPVERKDVLPIFENVLRMSNAALLRDGDLVKIIPAPEAVGSGVVSVGVGPPGFGVSVVPLRYTSAANVAKLAESFLTRPGALRGKTSC